MNENLDFHSQYCKLISDLDTTVLSLIRENLLAAPTENEKKKWQARMNESLDERLRLMKIRDGFKKDQS